MDHSQAVEQMAAERYLLNEMTPEAREAFEEHVFDCPDCALDLRAAAAFVNEAKAQLPTLMAPLPAPHSAGTVKPRVKRDSWLSWWRPVFAAPAFAALMLVLGYQNLVTLPTMRAEANQPRLVSWFPIRGATRGGPISSDREHGVGLPIDLSSQSGTAAYASYSIDLIDPQGKTVWTGSVAGPASDDNSGQRVMLAIPGAMHKNGAYTVAVSGIDPQGTRTQIDRFTVNLVFTN